MASGTLALSTAALAASLRARPAGGASVSALSAGLLLSRLSALRTRALSTLLESAAGLLLLRAALFLAVFIEL
ncbi:MAG TPA: hypothetical protein VMV81_07000 [Phycisphaerae bacterium]|nr:hypothetical protein [Phycisphaerae bacterium]